MSGLEWLIARPVAHRGLHDAQNNVVENTPSAFNAAIAGGYAIECDLQITADGEAMVYHDEALGRLTEGSGRLAAMTVVQLKQVAFKSTTDRLITLGELCDLVAGQVALVIELKSLFDGDRRLAARAGQLLAGYGGPAAVMSFDPAQVAALRQLAPQRPRGVVAEGRYCRQDWGQLPQRIRRSMTYLDHVLDARPEFIAYAVCDLPATIPWAARHLFRLPLLAWTVRTAADRQTAQRHADQMIFEGFRP
jgi:glycerophosphoryl diester phosphodiesterase